MKNLFEGGIWGIKCCGTFKGKYVRAWCVHSLANQTCKSDTGKTNISSMKNVMVNKYTGSF